MAAMAAGRLGDASLRARLLGCEVRRLRAEQCLTLTNLAAVTGLSASYLSEIERGKKTPSLTTLDRLAAGLGVTRDALVPPPEARLDAPGLPARLRAARERAGLTQEALAEAAGVSTGMIGQLESAATLPSLPTIERLARALGVSPCHLLVDDPDLQRVLAELGPAMRVAIADPLVQSLLRTAAKLDQSSLRQLLAAAVSLTSPARDDNSVPVPPSPRED